MTRTTVLAVSAIAILAAAGFAAAAGRLTTGPAVVQQGEHLVVVGAGMVHVYRTSGHGGWDLVRSIPLAAGPEGTGDPPRGGVGRAPSRPMEYPGIGAPIRAAPRQPRFRQPAVRPAPPRAAPAPQVRAPRPVAPQAEPRVQAPPEVAPPVERTPAITRPPRQQPPQAAPRTQAPVRPTPGTTERPPVIAQAPRERPAQVAPPQPTAPTAARPPAAIRPTAPRQGVFRAMPSPAEEAPPTPIGRQALTRPVPRAPFHGPIATTPPAPTPQVQRQTQQRLRSWVREHNPAPPPPTAPLPKQDTVGNPIPGNAIHLSRTTLARFNPNFARVTRVIGEPAHVYTFVPHARLYPGFFTSRDGREAFRRYHHRPVVVLRLFYPYYFCAPDWFAFNYPGYYPSCFTLWGYVPGWVYPDRCYYEPYESIYTPPVRAYDRAGLQRALRDIKRSWLDGDVTLLAAHLTDSADIRIFFNGEYAYTTSTEDYYGQASDVLATTHTISLTFGSPQWISTHEAWVNGTQVFTTPEGTRHTLYISYRLRRLGDEWYIVGFGSSEQPERNPFALYQ